MYTCARGFSESAALTFFIFKFGMRSHEVSVRWADSARCPWAATAENENMKYLPWINEVGWFETVFGRELRSFVFQGDGISPVEGVDDRVIIGSRLFSDGGWATKPIRQNYSCKRT